MMTTPEIRNLVKTRATVIEYGMESVVTVLAAVRDSYIASVDGGLVGYLAQMLAECSTARASTCRLYWDDGRRLSPDTDVEIQKLISLSGHDLPYKVIVQTGDGEIEKYL